MGEETNKQKMDNYIAKSDTIGGSLFEFEYYEQSDTVTVIKMRKDKEGAIKIPRFVSNIKILAWNEECYECDIYIPEGCRIDMPKNKFEYGISFYAKSINVESKHKEYSSKNGVLYSKDKTQLLAYPRNKKDDKYIVPSSVYIIGDYAFQRSYILNKIKLSKNLLQIGKNDFEKNILFSINTENEMFKCINGSLYSKDGNILYCLYGRQYNDIKVEEGTVLVKEQSICGRYAKLYLPLSLKYIEKSFMLFSKNSTFFTEIIVSESMRKQLKKYEKGFKITYY